MVFFRMNERCVYQGRGRWSLLIVCMVLVAAMTDIGIAADDQAKATQGDADSAALQVFADRIMPIFKSAKPSSCVQCHLAAVDLKNYILPTHEQTFAALRAEGLVDPASPRESKILKLIGMGDQDLDRGARLIHKKTRQAELDAFTAWIVACCNDSAILAMSADADVKVGPSKPIEVVRHARKSRVVESFARNVWSQRMRCFPCHTPHEIDKDNPKHANATKRHANFVAEYGAKMNIFAATPEATMRQLITSSKRTHGDRLPLINIADPANSLLVLKPTAKVPGKLADGSRARPSSEVPVTHAGGLKMHVNDQSYKSFMLWLNDYSATVGDRYMKVDELPVDRWTPTQHVLRMLGAPESWQTLGVVQMFVHVKDTGSDEWNEQPVAFTQSLVTPRRMVNGPLSMIAEQSVAAAGAADYGVSETAATEEVGPPTLPPGEYLIKVFLDADEKISKDSTLLLDENDFVGQVVVDATWGKGFPAAVKFSATDLKR